MSDKPTIAFPNGFLARLDAAAKAQGISRSAFVTRACIAALDGQPAPAATTPTPLPVEPTNWKAPCAKCGKPLHQHSLATGACPQENAGKPAATRTVVEGAAAGNADVSSGGQKA